MHSWMIAGYSPDKCYEAFGLCLTCMPYRAYISGKPSCPCYSYCINITYTGHKTFKKDLLYDKLYCLLFT